MANAYVLYNSKAGNEPDSRLEALDLVLKDEIKRIDVARISDYRVFFNGLEKEDVIVLAGGDGTLNRFVNATNGIDLKNQILYFPIGTGNDFARDLGYEKECKPFFINEYLKDLPTVTVKGKTCRFLNGIGYGIDGYCCEVGDQIKATPGKKVNYTAIAVKGLLFHYKPTNATVTVDGKTYSFRKTWLAPTMNGRFYGGGMMPTPDQKRNGETLSTMVFHGSGKLKTLMLFPSLFQGKHVKHEKQVSILSGKKITVEFDRPVALQIDGETVLNVSSYTASTAAKSTVKERTAALAAVRSSP